jgi:hypothetical protein
MMLAEIGDKMLTVPQLWLFGAFVSLPPVTAACFTRSKLGCYLMVFLAGILSAFLSYGAAREAFGEGSFSEAVQQEMGETWIAHSITAPFMPVILTTMVVGLRHPWVRRDPR